MNLNDRIERTKPYFLQFQVLAEEDALYAVARFPENWTIPDKNALKSTYKVEYAPMNNGVCFVTELKNGAECVFDALDYVIKFNKCVEERKELLIAKVNELKDLFAKEDLEKLKRLTFVFEKPKKTKPAKSSVDQIKVETPTDEVEEDVEEKAEQQGTVEDDSSLMTLAKNIAED